jgi:hypothetical protein
VNRLPQWLWRACAELGLRAELDFTLQLAAVPLLTAIARVSNLGAPKGMLIFGDGEHIRPFETRLLSEGYGFSVLEEPPADEKFDVEVFRVMFRDWGWTGELSAKPDWM